VFGCGFVKTTQIGLGFGLIYLNWTACVLFLGLYVFFLILLINLIYSIFFTISYVWNTNDDFHPLILIFNILYIIFCIKRIIYIVLIIFQQKNTIWNPNIKKPIKNTLNWIISNHIFQTSHPKSERVKFHLQNKWVIALKLI
jgi:hypothetical protein